MEPADRELFERSLRQACRRHTGEALDQALEDVGWREALEAEPRAAVSVLFQLQGRANATSSALTQVVADVLGVDTDVPIVLPALGSWRAPGRLNREHATVHGLGPPTLSVRDRALVVAPGSDKAVAVTVPVAHLTVRRVHGMDPRLRIFDVSGEGAATEIGPANWQAAVSAAQLALGYELVGASREMLDLAREHALGRVQFGRPISTLQVIRHRLADSLVAIEAAEGILDAAWLDPVPGMAAMAKALAGRGARTAARHCQQVLAGIGFTTEHPLHRYIRRVLILDELFGSARTLTRELGEELLRTRTLPRLVPL